MATVGLLFPLTGTMAASGRECVEGARLALTAAGLRAVVADAASADPAGAARKLVGEDGAIAVIGSLLSAIALPASEAACRTEAVFVEAAAVADELGERGLEGFVRTAPRARAFGDRAGRAGVELAGAPLPATAVVLYESSAFGRSLGASVARRVRLEAGWSVTEIEVPAGTTSVDDAAERIAGARPQLVFAACYTATAQALWRAVLPRRSWRFAMIGVGGGWLHLGAGEDAPDPDGVFVVDVAPSLALRPEGLRDGTRAERDRYVAAYRAQHGSDPTVYADLGHVGATLLADAIGRGGDVDRRSIVRGFRAMDVPDGGTLLGYGARFDAVGENLRAAPVVMQWRGRDLRVVRPAALATAEPVFA